MERKVLGFSGNIPLLGFGMMRLPLIEGTKDVNITETNRLVDEYMNSGMNYFDTAYMYHEGKSENIFKTTVADRYDRNRYLVADKLPMWSVDATEDLQRIFDDQLNKTGAGYFDYYLIHALDTTYFKKAEDFGAFAFIKQKKSEGKIKHLGFSFHDKPEVLAEILEKHGELMEFVQLQINYFDWKDEVQAERLYQIAREHNKPVIIMEPVKGGTLANVPDAAKALFAKQSDASPASYAIRFTASLEGVLTILSGMSNFEQMQDNIKTCSAFKKLTAEEYQLLDDVVPILKKAAEIPCTACNYCAECPQNIKIADNFSLYNNFKNTLDYVNSVIGYKKLNPADEPKSCVACGKCEDLCPQGIKIIENLKRISKKFA